jgi:hypothetical protein
MIQLLAFYFLHSALCLKSILIFLFIIIIIIIIIIISATFTIAKKSGRSGTAYCVMHTRPYSFHNHIRVILSGLVVNVLAIGSKVRGFIHYSPW